MADKKRMTRRRAKKWLYHLAACFAHALGDAEVLRDLLNVGPKDEPMFLNAASTLQEMFNRKSLGDWPDLTDKGSKLTEWLRRELTRT